MIAGIYSLFSQLKLTWLANYWQAREHNEKQSSFKLTILDSRTQNSYEIPVVNNAIQAIHLQRISAPGSNSKLLRCCDSGVQILDRGFKNTAVVESKITHVDGIRGTIQYRHYSIEQLYRHNDYEEVMHLLIWGYLPSLEEKMTLRRAFEEHARPSQSVIDAIKTFPRETPSFLMIIAGLSAWAATHPSTVPVYAGKDLYHNNPGALDEGIIRTMAAFTTVVALVHCHQRNRNFTKPHPQNSMVENMLLMIGYVDENTKLPDPELIKSLNRLWILYADHEMTNSTAAFLHATSSLADPISGCIASVASGNGPLHGGAIDLAYKAFEQLGTKENVGKLIADVKAKKLRLFGVGHRIYKTEDPRACFLRNLMDEIGDQKNCNPLLSVAMEIERIVSNDSYFTSRNLKVNADLYGCFVYSALGFEPKLITAIMMVSRTPGVLAHWRESMIDQQPCLWRPRQIFTGDIVE